MAKYRKKPVVIDAIKWTGENHRDTFNFLDDSDESNDKPIATAGKNFRMAGRLIIRTLEGEMNANPGDWIIKGTKGEFYPCKPDIFPNIYEKVEEPEIPDDYDFDDD